MSTKRLAESVKGLNSSLALAVGNLWPKKGWPIAVVEGVKVYYASFIITEMFTKLLPFLQVIFESTP